MWWWLCQTSASSRASRRPACWSTRRPAARRAAASPRSRRCRRCRVRECSAATRPSGRQPGGQMPARPRNCARLLAPRDGHGRARRVLQSLHPMHVAARDARRIGAEEIHHHRLARLARLGQHALGHLRRGRLGNQHDHLRGWDRRRDRCSPFEHRDAADLAVQVASAGADRLRDAPARADRPAPSPAAGRCRRRPPRRSGRACTTLAKASGTPLMIAVPQSGPMTIRSRARANCLSAQLVFLRHVVAEQHDVEPEPQRLHRLRPQRTRPASRSAPCWLRRPHSAPSGCCAGAAPRAPRPAVVLGLPRQVLHRLVDRRGQAPMSRPAPRSAGRSRWRRWRRPEAGFGQQRQVVLGGHDRRGLLHARQLRRASPTVASEIPNPGTPWG